MAIRALFSGLILSSWASLASARCTAIAVGKAATVDGSTFNTHNSDCAECDWRPNKVPAMDWPEGSMRPIYLITSVYPRQVRSDRGYTWTPENLEDLPQRKQWEKMTGPILGYIPQVPHTYALLEGHYGIMNEHQVSIGESTCSSKLWAAPVGSFGGKALLEASELSQIALERCATARCAVQMMGDLAMQYGFYSAEYDPSDPDNAQGEGGEALTVVDPNEAWMFHIIADETGTSAVWVAQRVPDDHITAVANEFVIQDVDPNSPDFMYSSNLWDVAERMGYWSRSSGTLLNFVNAYSVSRYHPFYATRRVWRVLSLAAPSQNLPDPDQDWNVEYPFSVKVEKKMSVDDVIAILRDHYDGTKYDTSTSLAGGPYGDPNRWDMGDNGELTFAEELKGEFPRTISLFRTSYSFVAVARSFMPNILGHVWLCQYAPLHSSYTPMYVASERLPWAYIRGAMIKYDPSSVWWNACAVGNYASRYFVFTIGAIKDLQQRVHTKLQEGLEILESRVLLLSQAAVSFDLAGSSQVAQGEDAWYSQAVKLITDFTETSGAEVNKAWKEFFPVLLTTYRDGQIITTNQSAVGRKSMFYPRWWLEFSGFFNIPGNSNPEAIYFAPSPVSALASSSSAPFLIAALAVTVAGFAVGRYTPANTRKQQYIPI